MILLGIGYRLLDAWSNVEFFRSKRPAIVEFLVSGVGTFLVIVGGLVLIALANRDRQATQEEHKPDRATPMAPSPASPGPDVPKGFLDFLVDAEQAGNRLNKLMMDIGSETIRIGKQMQIHTSRFQTRGITPERAHKVASDAAADMDRYSAFLERTLEQLRATGEVLGESYIGYFDRVTPASEQDKSAVVGLRDITRTLIQTIRQSRTSVGAYRDTVGTLRSTGASQSLNRASDRLMGALDGVHAFMKSLEGTLTKLVRVLNRKLEVSN